MVAIRNNAYCNNASWMRSFEDLPSAWRGLGSSTWIAMGVDYTVPVHCTIAMYGVHLNSTLYAVYIVCRTVYAVYKCMSYVRRKVYGKK